MLVGHQAASPSRHDLALVAAFIVAFVGIILALRVPGKVARHVLSGLCWIAIAELLLWYFRGPHQLPLLGPPAAVVIGGVLLLEYDKWRRLRALISRIRPAQWQRQFELLGS